MFLKKILFFLLLFVLSLANIAFAQHLKKDGTPDRRYKENKTSYSHQSSATYKSPAHHNSNYVYGVARDKHGRIKRSESAKREFMKQTGYSKGRRGYVVD